MYSHSKGSMGGRGWRLCADLCVICSGDKKTKGAALVF